MSFLEYLAYDVENRKRTLLVLPLYLFFNLLRVSAIQFYNKFGYNNKTFSFILPE